MHEIKEEKGLLKTWHDIKKRKRGKTFALHEIVEEKRCMINSFVSGLEDLCVIYL